MADTGMPPLYDEERGLRELARHRLKRDGLTRSQVALADRLADRIGRHFSAEETETAGRAILLAVANGATLANDDIPANAILNILGFTAARMIGDGRDWLSAQEPAMTDDPMTILAYAACIAVVAASVACIISDMSGHQVRCLPRILATHPAWWARYARARRHPAPGTGPRRRRGTHRRGDPGTRRPRRRTRHQEPHVSRFRGPAFKGAMRTVRELRRAEAERRNAATPPERRRRWRLAAEKNPR